jgi:DNA repair protein RecO (recombination protein O)
MTASGRVMLEPAWVLHRKPYRDTSELVDFFTRDHGRIPAVARGSRSRRRRVPMEPFHPLQISWTGRGELVTLTGAEPLGPGLPAKGRRLMSMFYINELLLKLTARHDAQPEIFSLYEDSLRSLAGGREEAPTLRVFERDLLEILGYGLVLNSDVDGRPIDSRARYLYRVEEGPHRTSHESSSSLCISGATLLAIRTGQFDADDCLREARILLTAALDFHLGGQPLRTRQVFNALRSRPT